MLIDHSQLSYLMYKIHREQAKLTGSKLLVLIRMTVINCLLQKYSAMLKANKILPVKFTSFNN